MQIYGPDKDLSSDLIYALSNGFNTIRSIGAWGEFCIPADAWLWISQNERDKVIGVLEYGILNNRTEEQLYGAPRLGLFAYIYAMCMFCLYCSRKHWIKANVAFDIVRELTELWGVPRSALFFIELDAALVRGMLRSPFDSTTQYWTANRFKWGADSHYGAKKINMIFGEMVEEYPDSYFVQGDCIEIRRNDYVLAPMASFVADHRYSSTSSMNILPLNSHDRGFPVGVLSWPAYSHYQSCDLYRATGFDVLSIYYEGGVEYDAGESFIPNPPDGALPPA